MQDYYSERPFTKDEMENVVRPVEMEQMILVLCIPLIGIFLAVILLAGENLMNRKKMKQKTGTPQCLFLN